MTLDGFAAGLTPACRAELISKSDLFFFAIRPHVGHHERRDGGGTSGFTSSNERDVRAFLRVATGATLERSLAVKDRRHRQLNGDFVPSEDKDQVDALIAGGRDKVSGGGSLALPTDILSSR
jgi:hypothetical protein